MKIFQYAILFHAKLTKKQIDDDAPEDHRILTNITSVLARDEREVLLKAAREIPLEFADKLDQVEIAVRPF